MAVHLWNTEELGRIVIIPGAKMVDDVQKMHYNTNRGKSKRPTFVSS